MENVLNYKGFIGSVQYHAGDHIFHGKIEFITDLVTFEGESVSELEKAFVEAVDDYIHLCVMANREPMRSFKGTFNVRVSPELHRKAAMLAVEKGVSLNEIVEESLQKMVG